MRDTFDHEAKAWNDSIDRNDTYIDDDYLEYDAGWICPICNKWYPSSTFECSICILDQEDYLYYE